MSREWAYQSEPISIGEIAVGGSCPNLSDSFWGDSKLFGQTSCRIHTKINKAHLSICQLTSHCFAQDSQRMYGILGRRGPLDISHIVVGYIAVFVINLVSRCRIAEKCTRNKAVYGHRIATMSPIQTHREIPTSFVSVTAKDVPRYSAPCGLVTPDSTKARNRIPALVADDWPPFFCDKMGLHRKPPFGVMRQAVHTALPLTL